MCEDNKWDEKNKTKNKTNYYTEDTTLRIYFRARTNSGFDSTFCTSDIFCTPSISCSNTITGDHS